MLRLVCAWYCALLLGLSGSQHIINPYFFLGKVLDYPGVTVSTAVFVASILPWLHLMLASVLIAPGVHSKTPFFATVGLGLLFLGAQSTVLFHGVSVDCGCFGPWTERPVGLASLGIAGSLVIAGLFGAWSTPPTSPSPHEPPSLMTPLAPQAAPFLHEGVEISIIMPVFNEVDTVLEVVNRVQEVASRYGWNWELLIVNDGSTDGTFERLNDLVSHARIRIFHHERNRGKGAAIRTALAAAQKEFSVIQDADLEYDPEQIAAMLEARFARQVDVVYGSRVLGAQKGMTESRMNVYALGVWVLNVAVHLLYGLRVTDEATCYKLFRTADLRRMDLTCEGFEFCPEVTAKAARLGLSILEIPIRYQPRSIREGKKIRWRDAIIALKTLWRFRSWTPLSR